MKKIQFRYHPNIYDDDILVHKSGICQCCGKQIIKTMVCTEELSRTEN